MKKKNIYNVEVAYICNGRDPGCRDNSGCYYRQTNGVKGPCMHTQEPKYAKYRVLDPKKHPERFDRFKVGNTIRYYEKLGRIED